MKKERYELQEVFEDGSFCWYLKDNDTKLLQPLVDLHNCVDLLNQQNARIKELESKLRVSNSQLASSELGYNELKEDYKKQEDLLNLYLKNCSELNLENQQLKKENIQLNNDCTMYETVDSLIIHFGIDKTREIIFQSEQKLKKSQKQKAIEELSNLKATLVNNVSPILLSYNEYVDKVFEIINNQIKELRG